MVVAGEGDATAVRMCSTKATNADEAGMSTTNEHGNNVRYGGTSGFCKDSTDVVGVASCKDGADVVGVATIDRVAVGKAADVEDSGGVVPKTGENTRFGGADNEDREFARDGVHVGGTWRQPQPRRRHRLGRELGSPWMQRCCGERVHPWW